MKAGDDLGYRLVYSIRTLAAEVLKPERVLVNVNIAQSAYWVCEDRSAQFSQESLQAKSPFHSSI